METKDPNTDVDKNTDLNIWLARVKQAQTRKDVFRILDEFRKYTWTDVQCQTMSHFYMRLIELMTADEDESDLEVASVSIADDTTGGAAAAAAVINEGPVWYEKM